MSVSLRNHNAVEIASPVEIDTIEGYEDRLQRYRDKRFTYVPLPLERKYVNTETGEVKELAPEQFIHIDASVFTAIDHLQDHPFLLVRQNHRIGIRDGEFHIQTYNDNSEEIIGSVFETAKNYPDRKKELLNLVSGNKFWIITLADVNRRKTKESLYPVIAELESMFAEEIKKEYTGEDQIEVIPNLSSGTIDRWGNARQDGLEMHVSEFMTLSEMLKVVGKNSNILERLGFSSRNKFNEYTGGIINLRNPVMHSSRTLVHNREDLKSTIERINRAKDLIERMGTEVHMRQYPDDYHPPWLKEFPDTDSNEER